MARKMLALLLCAAAAPADAGAAVRALPGTGTSSGAAAPVLPAIVSLPILAAPVLSPALPSANPAAAVSEPPLANGSNPRLIGAVLRAAERGRFPAVLAAAPRLAPAARALQSFPAVEDLGAARSREAGDRLMAAVLGADEPDAGAEPVEFGVRSPAAVPSSRAAARIHGLGVAGVIEPSRAVVSQGLRLTATAGWLAGFSWAVERLVEGLAPIPATPAFQIFRGVVVFWSAIGSLTLHEAAHAWMAERSGDVTARMAGQVSAKPWRFITPLSATLLLATSMLGFPFGFFSTVMQKNLLKPPQKAALAKVALAGPAMNLALAGALAGLILGAKALVPALAARAWIGGTLRCLSGVFWLNVAVAALNVIPLGPLDGQRVLRAALPARSEGGPWGRSWLFVFDQLTILAGLAGAFWIMGSGLARTVQRALLNGGAGTPFAHLGDPFLMTVVSMGVLLWVLSLRPWVRARLAAIQAGSARRRVLIAGGYPLSFTAAVLDGRAPRMIQRRLDVAVAWSGFGAPPRFEAPSLADPFELEGREKEALDLFSGKTLPLDEALTARLRSGDVLALRGIESGRGVVAILPSSAVGGPAAALSLVESQSAALKVGAGEEGRALLAPAEVAEARRLSEILKAPVYELAAKDSGHRRLGRFVQGAEQGVFFVSLDVLQRIAASPAGERERLAGGLGRYLAGLRAAALAGRSVADAHAALLAAAPSLSTLVQ